MNDPWDGLFDRTAGVGKNKHQNAAVGMELAACGRFRFGERIGRSDMGALAHQTRDRKCGVHVFALAVDCRINFVRDAIVSLITFEADVMVAAMHHTGLSSSV